MLQVVFGSSGVVSGITDGKGFVNMSVVDVDTSLDISEVIFVIYTMSYHLHVIGKR